MPKGMFSGGGKDLRKQKQLTNNQSLPMFGLHVGACWLLGRFHLRRCDFKVFHYFSDLVHILNHRW